MSFQYHVKITTKHPWEVSSPSRFLQVLPQVLPLPSLPPNINSRKHPSPPTSLAFKQTRDEHSPPCRHSCIAFFPRSKPQHHNPQTRLWEILSNPLPYSSKMLRAIVSEKASIFVSCKQISHDFYLDRQPLMTNLLLSSFRPLIYQGIMQSNIRLSETSPFPPYSPLLGFS